jgi:hypothetical protein
MFKKKKGQVWVETVIYTLIAFIMIGAVLAYAKPKVEQLQDKAIIEQSIGILKEIDSTILAVISGGTGNIRSVELNLKKGELQIRGGEEKIVFEMETRYEHSEPGALIENGNLQELTTKIGRDHSVSLSLNYGGKRDLTFEGGNTPKTLGKSSTPYTLLIENKGKTGNLTLIDIGLN